MVRNSSLKAVSWLTRTPDSPLRQRTARASLRNSTIRKVYRSPQSSSAVVVHLPLRWYISPSTGHTASIWDLLFLLKQPQLLPMHRRKIRPLPPMKRKKSAVNEPIFVYCRCFYASFVPLFFRSRITRTTISAANPTPVPTQPLAVIPAAR